MSSEHRLRVLNLFLFMSSLNFLAGNLGPLSASSLTPALVVAVMIIALAVNIGAAFSCGSWREGFRRLPGAGPIGVVVLLFVSIITLLVSEGVSARLIGLSLSLLGLHLLLHASGRPRGELYVLAVTAGIYSAFHIMFTSMPGLWMAVQELSLGASELVGDAGSPLRLGASASGLLVLVSFLCLAVAQSSRANGIRGILLSGLLFSGVLAGLWLIYLLVLARLRIQDPDFVYHAQYLVCVFGIAATVIAQRGLGGWSDQEREPLIPRARNRRIAGAAFFLALALCGTILTVHAPESPRAADVVLVQPGIGDYDNPEYGKYGMLAGGFFGQLPVILEATGHHPRITDEEITPDLLAGASILVVINPVDAFSSAELDAVDGFVESGGSLLVLGDHTDAKGIMEPLNSLVRPYGIEYEFTSGLPELQHWRSGLRLMHHSLLNGIVEDQFRVSVGATLDLSGPASPVISGTFGFADIGDYENVDRSYLGDYDYNPGEHLSDLVLVAASEHGKGRVLAFGDTSAFFNVTLAYTYEFVHGVMRWLSSERNPSAGVLRGLGVSLVLLLALVFAWKAGARTALLCVPLALALALFLSGFYNQRLHPEVSFAGEHVWLDTSHGGAFSLRPNVDNAVHGLITNLMREGRSCYFMREFSAPAIQRSRAFIVINPTRPYSRSELATLEEYVANGGVLVISTGYEFRPAAQSLLDAFEMDIANIPLGPVPYVEEEGDEARMEPRFVNSWPIVSASEDIRSLYSVTIDEQLYALVAFRRVGLGGVLLIGDSDFLFDANLESTDDMWPGNIKFLKAVQAEVFGSVGQS